MSESVVRTIEDIAKAFRFHSFAKMMLKIFLFKKSTEDEIKSKHEQADNALLDSKEMRGGHNRILKQPFLIDAAYSYVQLRIDRRLPVSIRDMRHYLTTVILFAAHCCEVEIPSDFCIKLQLVRDFARYLQLKMKKTQKYHPDVLRASFVEEYTAVREGIIQNFGAPQTYVTDEMGVHWNVKPIRSLSPTWTSPTCVGKTQMVKTSFCVAIRQDMTRESFVSI